MKLSIVFITCLGLCNGRTLEKRGVADAIKFLKGSKQLGPDAIATALRDSVAGKDYPNLSDIPSGGFDCSKRGQPGFYADDSPRSRCQVFYRCVGNGEGEGFLCPPQNIFNQVTLTCDWFYNVDCAKSKSLENYTNSRLSKDTLFDDSTDADDILAITKAIKTNKWSWKTKQWS